MKKPKSSGGVKLSYDNVKPKEAAASTQKQDEPVASNVPFNGGAKVGVKKTEVKVGVRRK